MDPLAALGVPSLLKCRSLKVSGPVRFADGVILEGEIFVFNCGTEMATIAPGTYYDEAFEWLT